MNSRATHPDASSRDRSGARREGEYNGNHELPRRGRLPALVAGTWSAIYLVLGIVWACGGPGYPFDGAGDPASSKEVLTPSRTLLDLLPTQVGGLTMSGIAVVTGTLTLLLVRRAPRPPVAVAAMALGLITAVVLTDVRILMTMGYLPVMLVALATGNIDPATIAAMANWPALNLLVMMIAGLSLTTLGMSPLLARLRPVDPGRALRVGQVAVAVAGAIPVLYATTRLGWLVGIPVGISREFLDYVAEITPIGAGLATLGLLGAALTVGLVRPWGEVWPRWVPVVRGRAIPARFPAYAAIAVAVPIASAGLMYIRKMLVGAEIGPTGARAEPGAWLPEMLWPLWAAALAVAALAYLLRRDHGLYLTRRRRSRPAEDHPRPADPSGTAEDRSPGAEHSSASPGHASRPAGR